MALKRNENLIALSREHHFGLLFCWKLRQGIKKAISMERMRLFVAHFWENHLSNHFRKEEQALFNVGENSLYNEAETEHSEIKDLVDKIVANDGVQEDDYANLANVVEQHIRFEERTLFPSIEQSLSEQDLNKIGAQLKLEKEDKGELPYGDEFWL